MRWEREREREIRSRSLLIFSFQILSSTHHFSLKIMFSNLHPHHFLLSILIFFSQHPHLLSSTLLVVKKRRVIHYLLTIQYSIFGQFFFTQITSFVSSFLFLLFLPSFFLSSSSLPFLHLELGVREEVRTNESYIAGFKR